MMISKKMLELFEIAVDLGITEDDVLNLIYKRCEEINKNVTVKSLKVAFCASRLKSIGTKEQNGKIINFSQVIRQ